MVPASPEAPFVFFVPFVVSVFDQDQDHDHDQDRVFGAIASLCPLCSLW